MASFTDAITQFNPYVAQLPVEAMVQVGMEKQKRYEEGVQKIQSQISEIAGLDLVRDVDKNYLQSKLDELGNNLKGVAAGDFSNFQLVNSVSGMTKQIVKDPIVQNAVSSTAWYRSQQKAIEEARKKGKSDKNNEEYFYNGANKWLTNDVAGSKFSDSFTEYTDIMKTIRESVTAAGIDGKYIEQIYETDDKGNILRDKNNHPIPARIMATETLDSNAEKVKAIVANVLSQGDIQQQIHIDGWANTRSVPVENVYNTFLNDFNTRDAQSNQILLDLQTQLDATNLSTEQRDAIVKLQNDIKNNQDVDLKKMLALRDKAIDDPEQFKIDYYQDGYTNNLISGFTTVKSKKEFKDSPLTKVLQWEEKMNFDRSNEDFNRKMQRASAARDERRVILDEMRFNADYELDPVTGKYKKVETGDGSKKKKTVDVKTPSEINAENEGAPIDAEFSYREGTTKLQTDAQAKGFDLIYTYLYKVNNGKTKDGRPYTKEQAQKDVNSWSKSNGETPYQFIIRFASDLKNKSEKNGVKLSIQDLEKVDEVVKLHDDITSRVAVTEDMYRQTKAETGLDPKDFQLSNIAPKSQTVIDKWVSKNLGVNIDKGPEITVQDQLDYIKWKSSGILKNTPEAKSAQDRLTKKFGSWADFENYAEQLQPGITQRLSILASNKNLDRYNKVLSEKFTKVNVVSDNFSSTLSGTDDELKLAKANVLALFNAQRLEEGEQQDIAAVLTGPGGGVTYDARRPVKVGDPWTGTIYVTDKEGKKHSVDVDQKNLEIVTGVEFKPYVEDGLRARANVSQFGSTNLGAFTTDPNAYQSAAIKSGSFSSLRDSDYTAFADIIPLSGGKLGIAIYAKDKSMSNFKRIEMVPVNQGGFYFTDYNEIAGVIPKITPAVIKNELTKLK